MANEGTKYADVVKAAALVETGINDKLTPQMVLTGRTKVVPFPVGQSAAVQLRTMGEFTATAGAEDTDHAREDYEQSSPATLTAGQTKVLFSLSKYLMRFSPLDIQEVIYRAAKAVSVKVETDGLALSAGFSNSVGTSGAVLDTAFLRSAVSTLELNDADGERMFFLYPNQIQNVRTDIATAVADFYAHPITDISIMDMQAKLGGYAGSYLGIPIYRSTLVPTANASADSGGMLITRDALAYGDGGGIEVEIEPSVKDSNTWVSVDIFSDWGENEDLAGCEIISVR